MACMRHEALGVSPDLLGVTAAGLVSLLSPERERRDEMSLTDSLGAEWVLADRLRGHTTITLRHLLRTNVPTWESHCCWTAGEMGCWFSLAEFYG